jgi:hypothetical protein
MAMNEGEGKLRELRIKCAGTVLFVKENLLVQTFVCHDKYISLPHSSLNIKFILREIIRSHEIKRERSKKEEKKLYRLLNRTGIV